MPVQDALVFEALRILEGHGVQAQGLLRRIVADGGLRARHAVIGIQARLAVARLRAPVRELGPPGGLALRVEAAGAVWDSGGIECVLPVGLGREHGARIALGVSPERMRLHGISVSCTSGAANMIHAWLHKARTALRQRGNAP